MRSRYLAGAFVALAVLTSACSSGGSGVQPTTTDPFPPSSTEPTTTESTTTTTTIATTTTEDPVAAAAKAEQAVRDAYFESQEKWVECGLDTPNCTQELLAESYVEAALENLWKTVLSRQEDGLTVRPPLNPAHLNFEIVSIEFDELMSEAFVISCSIDGRRVVDPGAASNGDDVVVNDEIASALGQTTLVSDGGGGWKVSQLTLLKLFPGPVGCDS